MTRPHLRAAIVAALAMLAAHAATTTGPEARQAQGRDAAIGAAAGDGAIGGVVTSDAGAEHVVRRVLVELSGGRLRGVRQAITDDHGRYQFLGLAPGRYSITAIKAGYVRSYHGARRPWRGPPNPIDLAAGEQRLDLQTVVQRGAAISGRVLDEFGQPIQGASMQVFERRGPPDRLQLQRMGVPQPMTDDRGEFRLYGLPPGEYVVSASTGVLSSAGVRAVSADEVRWALVATADGAASRPAAERPPAPGPIVKYSPVYHPSAPDAASAAIVALEPGQDRSGVDVVLRMVTAARVSGMLTMPDGRPAPRVSLALRRRGALPSEPVNASARLPGDGRFEFPAVEPGQWTLLARAPSTLPPTPPSPPIGPGQVPIAPTRVITDLWAELDITVDGRDVDGLALALQPGMTIEGHVRFGGSGSAVEALPQVMVRLVPAPGARTSETPAAQTTSGAFTINGAFPGEYVIQANSVTPTGALQSRRWVFESATIDGQEVADDRLVVRPGMPVTGLVVTVTDQPAELTGRILDTSDAPVTDFYVMVFAADPSRWQPGRRVRNPVRPQPTGAFRFGDLPPGEYYLAALADFDPQDIADPAFLEQVAQSAIRLSIGAGEKKVQDVRVQ